MDIKEQNSDLIEKKQEKAKKRCYRLIGCLWFFVFLIIAGMGLAVYSISQGWWGELPPISDLQNPINKYASRIYTSDNKVIGTWSYASENRVMMSYDSLPKNLVNALIATEDVRFYDHSGIDMKALARAIVKRGLMKQKSAGGGSTITQQLAKQLYSDVARDEKKRMMQKPIEWYIAVQLECYYTKEEIITMYLNYFDFLNNAVGIKNAANTYFAKQPSELSLEECATLVGMCKNPSLYNPVRFNERSRERRNVVLSQMQKAGYISTEEMEKAQATALSTDKFHITDHKEGLAPYFREYLRRIMMARRPDRSDYASWQSQQYYDDSLSWETNPLYGWYHKNTKKDGTNYNIYTDGLKIYTSLDSRMQTYAEEAAYEHVAEFLQPKFEADNKGKPNAPYSGLTKAQVDKILARYMRQSERYRVMKIAGHSEEEIEKAFNTKVKMTVFSYKGDIETEMTPLDSIKYYKTFLRTAFMAMDPRNGDVKAYVGGLNYKHFQYDNVMGGGRRQVGSTIKPFLYSLAMENGFTPCDVAPNVEHTYMVAGKPWTPRNSGSSHYGEMVTLKWGLSQSNNWISAYLMSQLNPRQLVALMHEMGITNKEIHPSLSLCLGPCDISVGEMVSAYTAFANAGVRFAPRLVTRIEDADGNVIESFTPRMNEVMSPESAYKMITMLRGVIDSGTGRRIRTRYNITADMGGKTGTTNSNADAWFMGFTPKLVVGCWVGGEDRDIHFSSMTYGQGASGALPVYGIFMNKVYSDKKLGITQTDSFYIPKNFELCSDDLDGLQEGDKVPETEMDIDESFQ